MNMQIPSKREFILNPANEVQNASEHDVHALVASSLNSFEHEDFAERHADKMAGLGMASAVLVSGVQIAGSAMGAVDVIAGVLVGTMTGAGVGALGIFGMILASSIVASCSGPQSETRAPELPLMPANMAELDDEVFQQALKSGIMPIKFLDPVTKDTIETPVAFSNDSTGTIYDLETVESLRQYKITRNPMGGNVPLDFEKLVYLPGVKKQIDEIKKKDAGEI